VAHAAKRPEVDRPSEQIVPTKQANPVPSETGRTPINGRPATTAGSSSYEAIPREKNQVVPLDVRQAASFLLARSKSLTEWELEWLGRIQQTVSISESDRRVLAAIEHAVYGPHLPAGTTPAVVDGVPGLVHASKLLANGRSENTEFTPADRLPRPQRVLVLEMLSGKGRSR
jgi:hypothetical protein